MEITNKSDWQFPRSLDSDLKIRITLYYRKLPTLKIVVFYVCHLADVLLIEIPTNRLYFKFMFLGGLFFPQFNQTSAEKSAI